MYNYQVNRYIGIFFSFGKHIYADFEHRRFTQKGVPCNRKFMFLIGQAPPFLAVNRTAISTPKPKAQTPTSFLGKRPPLRAGLVPEIRAPPLLPARLRPGPAPAPPPPLGNTSRPAGSARLRLTFEIFAPIFMEQF
jgi:hypothetical protein